MKKPNPPFSSIGWGTWAALAPVVLLMALAGCMTVGPDYQKPTAEVNDSWLESPPAISEEPADVSAWWESFRDPVLTRLVNEAYEQNLTLRAAGLRVIQARAARGIAIGEFFPQEQEISAAFSRSQLSKNNPLNPPIHNFQKTDLSFDAAWEIDFWGKFRRNIRAEDAALLASIADYDDVLVTLVAEVGLTYTQIRTLERRIELARTNIELQQDSLKITEVRHQSGKVSYLDVSQAQTTLASTQATVPSLESSLRDAKLSLCVLLGRTPGELEKELAGGSGIPAAPPQVAVGVPADLLRRRPDVRSAERVAAFQSEQVGIATADLFPSISIGGSAGLEASDAGGLLPGGLTLDNLFDGASFVGSIGPALRWPVLNYGRIRNNIRVQDAAFQQAAVDYQNTVLQAAAEVESALYGFLKAREQLSHVTESARSARESYNLSMIQYTEGDINFLLVDIAAADLTRQQDSQATVEGLVASNLIKAYKALGGGWELRLGHEFIPKAMSEEMQGRTNWGKILELPENSFPEQPWDHSYEGDLGFIRPVEPGETDPTPETEGDVDRRRKPGKSK